MSIPGLSQPSSTSNAIGMVGSSVHAPSTWCWSPNTGGGRWPRITGIENIISPTLRNPPMAPIADSDTSLDVTLPPPQLNVSNSPLAAPSTISMDLPPTVYLTPPLQITRPHIRVPYDSDPSASDGSDSDYQGAEVSSRSKSRPRLPPPVPASGAIVSDVADRVYTDPLHPSWWTNEQSCYSCKEAGVGCWNSGRAWSCIHCIENGLDCSHKTKETTRTTKQAYLALCKTPHALKQVLWRPALPPSTPTTPPASTRPLSPTNTANAHRPRPQCRAAQKVVFHYSSDEEESDDDNVYSDAIHGEQAEADPQEESAAFGRFVQGLAQRGGLLLQEQVLNQADTALDAFEESVKAIVSDLKEQEAETSRLLESVVKMRQRAKVIDDMFWADYYRYQRITKRLEKMPTLTTSGNVPSPGVSSSRGLPPIKLQGTIQVDDKSEVSENE
ncbi:hypothetical protein OF83DRAFT_1180444 [Amylostereum chailletii]|nr:hypothetical protein OF83DRAFT_1180444 [Amylostereum chailletii]